MSTMAAVAPQPAMTTIQLAVPPGAQPGQLIQAQVNGQTVQAHIPPGLPPGPGARGVPPARAPRGDRLNSNERWNEIEEARIRGEKISLMATSQASRPAAPPELRARARRATSLSLDYLPTQPTHVA